jgi:hypothetical protein
MVSETVVCTSGSVPFRSFRAGPPPLGSGVRLRVTHPRTVAG